MVAEEPARLLGALEEALATGLIREVGPRYFFSHALVRQTIYDDLSLPRRQRLHIQAASAIERVYAQRFRLHAGEVAMHYRLAGPAADPARAIEYSEQAAQAALHSLAYEEAARHWRAALGMLAGTDGSDDHRARIAEELGNLLIVAGLDYTQGVAHLREALKLFAGCGAVEESARLHCRLGHALSSIPETWDIPGAIAHFRAAEPVVERASDHRALGDLYAGLAQAAIWSVQIPDGLAWSQAAMDIAIRESDDRLWAHAAVVRGGHMCSSGDLAKGLALMERAWSTADRINDPVSFFVTFLGSAFASWLGDPPAAQTWCERELAQRRIGQAHGQRRRFVSRLASYYALGGELDKARLLVAEIDPSYDAWQVLFWSGDWEQCETIARQQVATGGGSGDRAFTLEATYQLAELARARGDYTAAVALLESVIEIPLSGGELAYELAIRALLALLFSETGELQAAEQHLTRCHEITANGEDWLGMAGRVWLGEGAWALAGGRVREGSQLLDRAIDVFRRHRFPWGEAETLYVWGRGLYAAQGAENARRKLDGAIEIYRRHGAGDPWLARVQRGQARHTVRGGGFATGGYPDALSSREVEVLRLIAAGRTNRQISDELCISAHTVARHISHIFDKTRVANRAEAASYAHLKRLN